MKVDNYFEIGNSHEQCQDFALSGHFNPNLAYAIVCDGCSESHKRTKEVDFGARILAYSAREAIKDILINKNFQSIRENTSWEIGQKTIQNTVKIGNTLKLSGEFADATLLIALSNGNRVEVFMYGDGGVLIKHKDGTMTYKSIHFMSSAPYYLSYTANNTRHDLYHQEFGQSPVIITTYKMDDTGEEISTRNESHTPKNFIELYELMHFEFMEVDSISIVSDGVTSYEENAISIPEIKIISQFVAFKNTNGIFQQRRMLFMKGENQKKNISHYDDISVATIVN